MRRDEVIQRIGDHRAELAGYEVASLSLFGSVARGDELPTSDVDVLVEFSKPVGLLTFVGLKLFLESVLGCSVDLATLDALRPVMRRRVLAEAIRAV
jgi:predicted nucleotidyltransferase